jgi:hypothetical protein
MSSLLSYTTMLKSWIRPWQKPHVGQPLPYADNEDKIITKKGWRQHLKKGRKSFAIALNRLALVDKIF